MSLTSSVDMNYDEAVKMYKEGMSKNQIMKKLHICQRTLNTIIAKSGLNVTNVKSKQYKNDKKESVKERKRIITESNDQVFLGGKVCPACGKVFYPQTKEWSYKIYYRRKYYYTCTYSCMKKWNKEE